MGKLNCRASEVLARAVTHGDEVMVVVALALGARPNITVRDDTLRASHTLLNLAAKNGHAHLVPHLLAAGLPVDGSEMTFFRPLHFAVAMGHLEVVMALLSAGANPNVPSGDGRTPLHCAAYGGMVACAEMLLKAKADVNSKDKKGRRPLHDAASRNHKGVVLKLLDAVGCDRHAKDVQQSTALHEAAGKGGMEVTQCLVLAGLHLEARNVVGHTPLDEASHGGHHLVEWWLRKLPLPAPPARTPKLTLVLRYSRGCEEGYQRALEEIKVRDSTQFVLDMPASMSLHQQDATGRTLLHWAAELGQTVVVRSFLTAFDVYPHVVTWAGETPADLARQAGHHQVLQHLVDHQAPQVQGSPEELYNQLLSVITHCDDYKQARVLLSSGAPLESPGGLTTQPLPLAITSNRPKLVSLLLAAGAPLTTTCQGLNLLTLAWRSPDVTPPVQVFISRAFLHVLAYERDNLTRWPELTRGVGQLMSTITGDTPWRASWPSGGSVVHLTALMVQAACASSTLTCSFIHEAGGHASLSTKAGMSPLHAALEAGHWNLARHMLKNMGGCLYVADSTGRLPTTMMSPHLRQQLEQNIYNNERNQLEEVQVKLKDKVEKQQVQEILHVQQSLFIAYLEKISGARGGTATPVCRESFDKAQALLVASQSGLLQLIYLLVKEGGVDVDTEVDPSSGTTALHQAASFGKSSSVLLLLSLGAEALRQDRYRQTPLHLAAMFGHEQAFQILEEILDHPEPSCRAGTTPTEVKNNFSGYLEKYHKFGSRQAGEEQVENDPADATMNLLKSIDLKDLLANVHNMTVDYNEGEAKEVKEAVTKELKVITEEVAKLDRTYTGTLTLLGSTADATRLYCPDEFDFNLTLSSIFDVTVKVIEQTEKEVLFSGHSLRVEIKTKNPSLQGNKLMSTLYDRVRESLGNYDLQDDRLSVVPPGVSRTQVGVTLSLAWQGSEYPLLLVDVDLVPVLTVTWPQGISRPPLTPTDSQVIHLSNTGDAKWRGSFAATEVEVIKHLDPQERQVFLTGKTLLSRMKAEPWMPRDVKNQFSWWDSRYWGIPIPAGFCFKNSFLKLLLKKREEKTQWKEEDTVTHVKDVFEGMCLEMEGTKRLVPAKVHAYFGGDCEKPKVGEGAPHITEFLKKYLKETLKSQTGNLRV